MVNSLQKMNFATKIIDLKSTLNLSKHNDLKEHSLEVAQIARMILKSIQKLNKEKTVIEIDDRTQNILKFIDIDTLADIYELHDLGKVFIPEFILDKPDRLTPEEYMVVKQHPIFAERLLDTVVNQEKKLTLSMRAFYDALYLVCGEHHENYDGSGYPNKLKGNDISLLGRIARVADVISALMGKRCYDREIVSFDSIAGYLKEQSGALFDEQIVNITISQNLNELNKKFQKKKDELLDIFNFGQSINKIILASFVEVEGRGE